MMLSEMQRGLKKLRRGRQQSDLVLFDEMSQIVANWLDDESPPADLVSTLEHYVGNSWFSTDELNSAVVLVYEQFGKTVKSLGGMSVNERLVMFGLMDRWDSGSNEDRENLRKKLLTPS